jgi:hypothetical protein
MTEAQTFRRLTEPRILRVLELGGMITVTDGLATLYRRRDGRSHQIGQVPPHVLARLQAEDRLQTYFFNDRFVLKTMQADAETVTDTPVLIEPETADPRYARAAERFRADYSIAGGMGRRLPFKWAKAGTYERGARDRLTDLQRTLGLPKQRLIERRVIARASLARLSLDTRDPPAKIISDLTAAYDTISAYYQGQRPALRAQRARLTAQARDHRAESIGALLTERSGDTDLLEEAFGIENRDGRRWRAIEQTHEEGDQT